MSDNMSNRPEQGHNAETDTNPVAKEPSYSDIMAALESGDSTALDRLMAVNVEQDDEPEGQPVNEPDGENKDKSDETETDEGQGSPDNEPANPLEAANAASNAPAKKEPAPQESDELRRELHRMKSELGRVGALQRRVQQLEGELRASRARTSANEPTRQSGNSDQPDKPVLPEKVRTRIEQLRAVDPDLADTLTDMYESVAQNDNTVREDVMRQVEEQRIQEENERFYNEQKTLLTEMVPQHEQVFAMPEWSEWKDSLLPNQRAMAESGYAIEVAQALQAYAYWYQQHKMGGQSQSSASSEGGDPNASTKAEPAARSNGVTEQRNRKIEASAGVKNPPARATEVFDAEAEFHETYSRLLKERGIK